MYYKITKIGDSKYSDMGMVEVMASFYLEKGDEGYDKYIAEHYVEVDKVMQLNPFCNHSIQFEADVTEKEILSAFDRALSITHQNYLIDDLHCKKGGQVVNTPFNYLERKAFYKTVRETPIVLHSQVMSLAQAKITSAKSREEALKTVDFIKVSETAKVK